MTQLEIDIQILEGTIRTLNDAIAHSGSSVPKGIIQQRDQYIKKLEIKKKQLATQRQETVYEHLARTVGYSQELKDCIEDTVDNLLKANNSKVSDPGLLLGKIQCGKTRAFVGIIGLMFDKNIDIAIVLTKGTKALAQQTKTRMENEFSAFA